MTKGGRDGKIENFLPPDSTQMAATAGARAGAGATEARSQGLYLGSVIFCCLPRLFIRQLDDGLSSQDLMVGSILTHCGTI